MTDNTVSNVIAICSLLGTIGIAIWSTRTQQKIKQIEEENKRVVEKKQFFRKDEETVVSTWLDIYRQMSYREVYQIISDYYPNIYQKNDSEELKMKKALIVLQNATIKVAKIESLAYLTLFQKKVYSELEEQKKYPEYYDIVLIAMLISSMLKELKYEDVPYEFLLQIAMNDYSDYSDEFNETQKIIQDEFDNLMKDQNT